MAQTEGTLLLHFDIDEQPAVQSINSLRTANKQLTQERNAVNTATKEGQAIVAQLNTQIDKNNKLIKDNSSALEKQRQNVGNYSKSIQEAAGQLNIMGTNVGALGTKLQSFVNPLTATVGLVTALGAAYARSTIGAKDLEFASNQLSAATTILTNSFAALISSGEDGEGLFSTLTNDALQAVQDITNFFGGDSDIAKRSRSIAMSMEEMDDLRRDEIRTRALINDRLAENQENMTAIQDSQTDLNEKLHQAGEIIDNLRLNETELLAVKNAQLAVIEKQLESDQKNDVLLDARETKLAEISAIQKDTDRRVEATKRLTSNLTDAENKRVAAIQKQNDEIRIQNQLKGIKTGDISASGTGQDITDFGEQEIKVSNATTVAVVKNNEIKGESAEQYVDRVLALQEAEAAGARDLAGTLASIAEEGTAASKALALTSIAINSGIGVSEAVKAGAGIPFPGNLAAILSGITAVLVGIDQARDLLGGAAAGGGDFITTKPTLLMVGDNPGNRERVTVEPLSGKGTTQINPKSGLLQMGGGGSLTFNPSISDGGFITNTNTQQSQQALLMQNFMKNFPPIYASWTEGQKVGKKLQFKAQVSKL